jgi:hypothetical protein
VQTSVAAGISADGWSRLRFWAPQDVASLWREAVRAARALLVVRAFQADSAPLDAAAQVKASSDLYESERTPLVRQLNQRISQVDDTISANIGCGRPGASQEAQVASRPQADAASRPRWRTTAPRLARSANVLPFEQIFGANEQVPHVGGCDNRGNGGAAHGAAVSKPVGSAKPRGTRE